MNCRAGGERRAVKSFGSTSTEVIWSTTREWKMRKKIKEKPGGNHDSVGGERKKEGGEQDLDLGGISEVMITEEGKLLTVLGTWTREVIVKKRKIC